MFQRGVYPYKYVDDWEKFNETSVRPAKEAFYSHLSLGDITDADYAHSKRVCKDFVKKIRRTSRFVCLKWYIIVSWCIWKL